MSKIVVLKQGSESKMSNEMKKAVNEAFDGADEAEDEEVADTINADVKTARAMINEIEEELDEMDEKELTVPNQDYVDRLIMSLQQYVEKDEEDGE